jgi:DNA-binding LytR/AlgR family response regulator
LIILEEKRGGYTQMNIAICDDQLDICGQLELLVEKILKNKKVKYNIDVYSSGIELCKEMSETEYQLVFLDVEMPEKNGVEIGRYIREKLKNEKIQIAYISSKEESAMSLFELRPINFLIKPLRMEQIEKVIDKYIVVSEIHNYFFEWQKGKEHYKIPMDKINYFEISGRKIHMLAENMQDEFYGSIEEINDRLNKEKFLFIHKSTIVNYDYVKKISYEQVEMVDGRVFSISQSRRKSIKKQLEKIKNKNN